MKVAGAVLLAALGAVEGFQWNDPSFRSAELSSSGNVLLHPSWHFEEPQRVIRKVGGSAWKRGFTGEMHLLQKTSALIRKPQERKLAQAPQATSAFTIGDHVTWMGSDDDVPSGTVGIVADFDDGDVAVRFPSGTFSFLNEELAKEAPGERLQKAKKELEIAEKGVEEAQQKIKEANEVAKAAVDTASDTPRPHKIIELDHPPSHHGPIELNSDTNVGKDVGARQNPFSAESPAVEAQKTISADAGVLIKWSSHTDKCLCGNEATNHGDNSTLTIEKCDDASKADNMKFVLPAGDFSSGLIKWKKDPSKCMYVRNGWQGNGNPIYLWNCNDATSFQAMNFSIFTPNNDITAITWSHDLMRYPSRCLDVKVEHGLTGNPIQLWDCSAGAMWKIDKSAAPPISAGPVGASG